VGDLHSIATARIETERPSRYLVQLCRHASAMDGAHGHTGVRAEWSETHGTVHFGQWGRCVLDAEAGTLTVRVEADDEDGLRRIQEVVSRDLDRFGRRDRLAVDWQA
jgi:hypothetical protein